MPPTPATSTPADFTPVPDAPALIPDDATVAAAFARVAAARDNSVALHTSYGRVTYRDLAAATLRWAASSPVGGVTLMIADLSPQTVAAVLGTFSAGGILVPLDPALPAHRADAVVATLERNGHRVDALITDARNRRDATRVTATGELRPAPRRAAPVPARPRIDVQSVTSLQFTSGSTGAPKAVLHTNGMWLCDSEVFRTVFGVGPGRRVAVCMPISFAGGLNILLGSLLCGAEVIAIDPRDVTPHAAADRLAATGAEIVVATPSFIQNLGDAAGTRVLASVARVVTTGEAAHTGTVQAARRVAPQAVFTNWVGSSETLSISTFDIAPGDPIPAGPIPAGRPAHHKHISLADDGTMTVTSPYVARGYLEPDSATTRFEYHDDGRRSFVSSDLGRWTDDGVLMLRGRADTAVKVRGYLVEPAEVEAALLRHPEVREAVVTAHTGPGPDAGSPELWAHVSPAIGVRAPSLADIRTHLHDELPSWMVPAHIMVLAALPRTERGKVDRQALPTPDRGEYVPPMPGVETAIAEIWSDALSLERVGRTESFYSLGGDSMTVVRILTQVKDRFGVVFTQSELASSPTVAQFAADISIRIDSAGPSPRAVLAATTVALRAPSAAASQPPWFCFSGAGASALTFAPLAGRAEADRPIYAFQPNGLENRGFPDWSILRAARRHLKDLRRLQPRGPYTLIGHSLGAFIALDMARLLEGLGDTVELVALLDPFLPPGAVRAMRRQIPDATLTLDAPSLRGRELWSRRLRVPLAGIVQLDQEAQAKALEEVGVRVGLMHRPEPWSGRTLLLLSHLNQDDPRLWRHLLTGDLQVRHLDCDHHSIVREPYVGTVADLITRAVQPAPSSRTSPITP